MDQPTKVTSGSVPEDMWSRGITWMQDVGKLLCLRRKKIQYGRKVYGLKRYIDAITPWSGRMLRNMALQGGRFIDLSDTLDGSIS